MKTFVFDIAPIGKPRMTRRDKFIVRDCVARYRAFADELRWLAKLQKFTLESGMHYLFLFAMPSSWSAKKKATMNGQPMLNVPDLDNCIKAVWDSLAKQDKRLAVIGSAKKIWAYKPGIVISINY